MSKEYEFIKDCGCFFIVTMNGDFPACRPFGAIMEVGENLYISTHDGNEAHKQLRTNGNIQLIAKKEGTREWLRITGIAKESNDVSLKQRFMEECPVLVSHYSSADSEHFLMFKITVKKKSLSNYFISTSDSLSNKKEVQPMDNKDIHQYDDIINLPHHQSATRPHMSNYDRAAQFSPFAALTGHDEAIKETARLTDRKIELDEYTKEDLNSKLQIIGDNPGTEVTITYFQPDEKKSGGAYLTITGCVKRIDEFEQTVVFTDRTAIPIDQISEIESELFRGMELFDL